MMTATPIPRSLVLTVFGDTDVSLLREKPVGRERVITYWTGENRREAVYDFVKDVSDNQGNPEAIQNITESYQRAGMKFNNLDLDRAVQDYRSGKLRKLPESE